VNIGFIAVEVLPSPNSQYQPVAPKASEESVKVTASGAVPEVGVPENPAVGGTGAETLMYPLRFNQEDPEEFVTRWFTVKTPDTL
jgi:hypothetical protein